MMDPHPDSSTSVSERASHPAEAGESAAAADSPGPERLAALVDLGRKLAEARQAQGIPLPVLAEQNYLSADRLDALECGDHTRLPERIYLIAQARRVATSLGLDADELTEPLLNIHLPGVSRSARTNPASPAPGQTSAPVARVSLAAPAMAPRESSTGALLQSTRKPRRGAMPWLLAGGAGVLALAAGLAMGWNQSRPTSSKLPTPPLTPEAREAETSTQEEPAESAAQPQPGQGSLQLSSREPSWLEVRNGEGKELFRGLFTGTGNFSLAEGLQVLAGRPDLITVTTASGESETLGTIEEISWQRFSSSGERDSPPARPLEETP
jgi:cytoskeleton protein RodZ